MDSVVIGFNGVRGVYEVIAHQINMQDSQYFFPSLNAFSRTADPLTSLSMKGT